MLSLHSWDVGMLGCHSAVFRAAGILGCRDAVSMAAGMLGCRDFGMPGCRVYSSCGAVFGSPKLLGVAAPTIEQLCLGAPVKGGSGVQGKHAKIHG